MTEKSRHLYLFFERRLDRRLPCLCVVRPVPGRVFFFVETEISYDMKKKRLYVTKRCMRYFFWVSIGLNFIFWQIFYFRKKRFSTNFSMSCLLPELKNSRLTLVSRKKFQFNLQFMDSGHRHNHELDSICFETVMSIISFVSPVFQLLLSFHIYWESFLRVLTSQGGWGNRRCRFTEGMHRDIN